METRFSKKKLTKTKKLINNALRVNNILKHNLEKLIDFLTFCAKIIILDCSFFILLYKALDRATHFINITNVIRSNFL